MLTFEPFSTSVNEESLMRDKQETTYRNQKCKETDLLRNETVKQRVERFSGMVARISIKLCA